MQPQQDVSLESFEKFVMTGARAMLNETDLAQIGDGPIPDDFVLTASPVPAQELEKAKARLEELKKTREQGSAAMRQRHEEEQKVISLCHERQKVRTANAEALLKELDAWQPPTIDHMDFKHVLRGKLNSQIGEAALQVCVTPENINDEDYLTRAIGTQKMYIARLERNVQKEASRVKMINDWLAKLRQSLRAQVAKKQTA